MPTAPKPHNPDPWSGSEVAEPELESTERLFLAVDLNEETRDLVAAHLRSQAFASWPGKLVAPKNWHITLRFLGATDRVAQEQVLHYLDAATLPGPFRIRLDGPGAFPRPSRATVSFLAVTRGEQHLHTLAAACEQAAQAAGLIPEDRPYTPHMTLSRTRPAVDMRARFDAFVPLALGVDVQSVTLFRSRAKPTGTEYVIQDSVDL